MTNQVLGTLTMEHLGLLRKMTHADAELFLQPHVLTDQERQYADKLIGKDLRQGKSNSIVVRIHDPTRPLWVLAAWLAGASWRQLAKLHSVAPQTLMAAADRLLLSSERQVLRIKTSMSLEALDTYHKAFTEHVELLSDMTPHGVAQWLLDNTELDREI